MAWHFNTGTVALWNQGKGNEINPKKDGHKEG